MTKVGEGIQPQQPSEESSRMQLKKSILRFQSALNEYPVTFNEDEKSYLRVLMSQQMDLIKSSLSELHRAGIHKQGELVQNDYEEYLKDPSVEKFTTLTQDLSTLKEYSNLPAE